MKPVNHVITWLLELFSLMVLFSLLCYFVPEEQLFWMYVDSYGFVAEVTWKDGYSLVLLVIAVLMNCGLIWSVMALYNKRHSGLDTVTLANPMKRVIISIIELLIVVALYNSLYAILPDKFLYALFKTHYGTVVENKWYTSYMMGLMLLSVCICAGIIWFVANRRQRNTKY